jgi:hypothetical protein
MTSEVGKGRLLETESMHLDMGNTDGAGEEDTDMTEDGFVFPEDTEEVPIKSGLKVKNRRWLHEKLLCSYQTVDLLFRLAPFTTNLITEVKPIVGFSSIQRHDH